MSALTLVQSTTMLDAALDATARGWAVFPCHHAGPRAKSPLTAHGHLDASLDESTIRAWWTRWPSAMIGAPVPTPLLVLDIDPRNGGSLEALEAAAGLLPKTLTAWSGRGDGGRHLYFRRPAGTFTSTRLPAGVDLKAAGYLILPPSLHPATGRPYVWQDVPVAQLPPRAAALLRPAAPLRVIRHDGPPTGPTVAGLLRTVRDAPEGRRNAATYWSARRLLEHGAADALDQLVQTAVDAGLPEREARATVRSATTAHGRGTR